jgi:hypothetical protein
LEIKKTFRFGFGSDVAEKLESSRPWSVYYSGPKGQRNRPSGSKVIDDFVVRDLRGTLQKTTAFSKLLSWRSSPEPCMPKYAVLNANFCGKSVTIHVFGTKRAKDASYRALDASQRSRKKRSCRWAAGDVRARRGTSAGRFAVKYAY